MDSPINHLLHALVIALIIYVIMRFGLKQSEMKAQTRSLVVGLLAGLYMLLFGHGMPTKLNKNIL